MSSFHSKYAAKALKKLEEEERLKEEERNRVEAQHTAILFFFGIIASPLAIYMVISIINYFFY